MQEDKIEKSNSETTGEFVHLIERHKSTFGLTIGVFLLYASLFVAYIFWKTVSDRKIDRSGDMLIIGTGATFILAIIYSASNIIISSTRIKYDIIPNEDRELLEPLISAGDEKAIEQYVRLSSLTGATGTATRLGLTGLPLLTVALTLIFSGLELYRPGAGFMDLAKLTLGAFIGSFVQRSATTQAVAATGRVPLSG